MLRLVRQVLLTLCLLLPAAATFTLAQTPASTPAPTRAEATTRAQAAAAALLTLYNQDTGLFNTTGWWNSANAITALTDTSRLTRDKSIRPVLRNTFDRAPHGTSLDATNFLNEFYDDEGWWALAWIDAYQLTHDKRYLHMAQTIFTNMSGGWDTTCGGGIWWKKDRHYKNAIANELFLDVASKLALQSHGKHRAAYLDWANREWTWFSQSGMINPDGLINDGLDDACHNNGKTTWTYNQGVVLGGLTSLSRAAKSPDLLQSASRIASAAITHLTDPQGILHDPCEPNCGDDGVQFKGIFARNLAELQTAAPDPAFPRFLEVNARTLWQQDRTTDASAPTLARFSTVWSGPPAPDNAAAQTSALDLLNAAANVTP